MAEDITQLVGDISPYVTAAVAAYGAAVLDKAKDESAEAGVAWGRKMLQRIFGTRDEHDAPAPVRDLADRPDDADLQMTLHVLIREVMRQDAALIQDIRGFLAVARDSAAPVATLTIIASAVDNAQQAVQGHGYQSNTFHKSSE
ncbi:MULTISPECIES: hypothetical protein [Nonomuraea]|uniref:Uncharacterized protein n=1 Tax=Nonomuraea ferruginea TaxID=46174 RepID=A0ABT4SW75_9ACTN|nr:MULTISPECIES: hypothetical protein [Nonomuraea]MDA0641350.1 hypothetical protein [Nonomuraea ferruginea]TXK35077.1 hypothetical protein FR742_38060 [Nonomuraea sp. C10]